MAEKDASRGWTTTGFCTAALLAGALGFSAARQFSPPELSPAAGSIPLPPAPAPAANVSSPDADWRELSRAPISPRSTRERAAFLEKLARTDPQRALALSLAEGNWLVRDQLRNAALRGWGAVAPDAASAWAMGQKLDGDRLQSVNAVLTGAAEQPDAAVRVALRLCAQDPVFAGDFGHTVVNAIVEKTGAFEAAARFAIAATMVDRQSFLLDSAFYQWAQHEPDRARAAFNQISDPQVRGAALKGVIHGWADSDPQRLADFAQALPPGEDRSRAFAVALPHWVGKDPEAVLQWVGQLDPDPDFDKGFAALALLPSILQQRPAVAMELTENIVDSAQRTLTRQNAFYQWALEDPAAARKYAEAHPNPELRAGFLEDVAVAVNARNNP